MCLRLPVGQIALYRLARILAWAVPWCVPRGRKSRARQNSFRLTLQCDDLSAALIQNFSLSFFQKIRSDTRIPPRWRGAFRPIVTTREAGSGGRGWRETTIAPETDGEIVWSWPPGAEAVRRRLVRRACVDASHHVVGAIKPVPKESAYKP